MRPKPLCQDQSLLFQSRLSTQLNPKHELLRAKLIQRSIERIVRSARGTGIQLKRSYQRVSRRMLKEYLRLAHSKKFRKSMKPLGKLQKFLGKLLANLDSHLENYPRGLLKEGEEHKCQDQSHTCR